MTQFGTILLILTLLALVVWLLLSKPRYKPPTETDDVINRCKSYVTIDREIRDNEVESDANKFNESHCKDIEFLIRVVRRMK